LAEDQRSIALIESTHAAGKPVALVCHAPGVLRHVKSENGSPLGSPFWSLILGAGYLYLRLGSPREERPPPDERDRAIEHRSISAAYYVLIAGMILVGCFMPFSSRGWTIVNAAIFWIVAAEVVHYGVVVASYRVQAS
jgi:hypothetical protein